MQPSGPGYFATTHWSLVLHAGQQPHSGEQAQAAAERALESLCQAYWYPLYAFARRRGYSRDDAADLTQSFFSQLIEKSWLETASPERGRFRTFLLTVFQRFLAKELAREQTQKRGGLLRKISIDAEHGETRLAETLIGNETPEHEFERHWAMTLLGRVLDNLANEYSSRGKAELFEECRGFLSGTPTDSPEIARRLRLSEGAVRVAVHRLRERFRELLRQEVAGTVATPEEIDDELNSLRKAIRAENR